MVGAPMVCALVFLREKADRGDRVEVMSIHGMRGYSLGSPWLKLLQIVD